jgi:lysophospholipid acyltransferase (LPLAT)-like uncharacterized protein
MYRKILGFLIYVVSYLLYKTLKMTMVYHEDYQQDKPYLFAFWHGKQFLPIFNLIKYHKIKGAVLVSPSKDGDILTASLKQLGYEVIRGSSRKRNVSALMGMIRRVKQGQSIGFGIDGPIGPIHIVKPGMTHMAQKYNVEILPIGSAFSRKWVFEKAWDKFELPKPFSKAAYYMGKPFIIPLDADLEHYNVLLEHRIHDAEIQARQLLNKL